jgi:hypothetical protein
MITCSKEDLKLYVVECGYEYTSDIFFLFGNVYMRLLVTKHYVTKHPGNVIVHRQVQSNEYLCWNYENGVRRSVEVKDYTTQLKAFLLIKELHDDYLDKLTETILENDLSTFAFKSELLL